MASFVSGGGGSKYDKIIENSIQNNGLGWVTQGDNIIAQTSISSSDWQSPLRSGSADGYYVDLSYVSDTNRVVAGKSYTLTVGYDGVEYTSESQVYIPSIVKLTKSESESVVTNVDFGFFSAFNSRLGLQDDGTNVQLWIFPQEETQTRSTTPLPDLTVKLDDVGIYHIIDEKLTNYIITYDYENNTIDKTYTEILEAYNSNKSLLLKVLMEGGIYYLPLLYYALYDDGCFIFSFFNRNLYSYFSVYIYEDSGETQYYGSFSSNIRNVSYMYTGKCITAASTALKETTFDYIDNSSINTGRKIAITFTYGIDASTNITPQLKINGTTYSIYIPTGKSSLTTADSSQINWADGETVLFTYNGNGWIFEGSSLSQYNTYNLANSVLPSQTGNSGKFLTTNGTAASWVNAPTELYKCTYGTTTYNEIETAFYYNDKLPYLIKGQKCYIYSGGQYGDYQFHYFDNVSNGVLSRITCSDLNNWSESTPITVMVKGTDYVTAGQKSGTTLGEKATAEGDNTTASGINSHAEGSGTKATSAYAHAEGVGTTASNSGAHAEGMNTTASGMYAHAEGWTNTASSQGAHAEGMNTYATNQAAHAEGCSNTASGYYSHAEGYGTTAQRRSQHVFGELNVLDTGGSGTTVKGTYVEIVGNGTADNARSNARTLDWSGNETLAGKLTVGADPVNNMDVATKQYVDNSKEIFIATYGTTTYAEINTAYTAGKTVIVARDFNGTTIYTLTNVGTSGTYHFRTFGSSANISYGCYIGTDSVWHVNSNTFASQSALETGLAEKQKTITVSTEEPDSTDGVDGDIWFVYEE